MSRVELSVVWTDDDGMLQLSIKTVSPTHASVQETYLYPDNLAKFADELRSFPRDTKSEVVLESGSKDPKWHDYLRLRVFVLKPTGYSAMEVESDVRGSPPVSATSHFYVPGTPADFNRLGSEMSDWLKNPIGRLVVEWRDA
jgi:hypothetical protein